MSVACIQCESRATGLPPRVEALPEPVCWSHRLESMLSIPAPDARFVVVVARHETALFERVSDQLLDEPRVSVVMDRRRGERRHGAGSWRAAPIAERRRVRPATAASRTASVEVARVGGDAPWS